MTTVGDSPEMLPSPEPVLDPRVAVIQNPDTPPEEYEAAFGSIVVEYADVLHGVALRLVNNQADAEDVVQTSLLKASEHIGTLKPGSLLAWMAKITRNVALDRLKQKRIRPEDLIDEGTEFDTVPRFNDLDPYRDKTGDTAMGNIVMDEITEQIEGLPGEFRDPMLLLVFEDLSYEQISERLGIPEGTVKSRISRARRRLQEQLGPMEQFEQVA